MTGNSSNAAAPFDHAKADIILRSSDNVYFRIFKLFLSLASPFFETLFDIPQPAEESDDQEVKDGLVVLPVTEDSKTLDALLRFCYPCTMADDPNIEVLEHAVDVLEAARKYSLDAIEKKARQAIANPKILQAEPLRCFAIARRGQLQEETLLAARHTLTQPLIPSWFQEINLITASDLLALLTYHRECGEAVYMLTDNLSWIKTHYGSSQSCMWLSGKCHYTTVTTMGSFGSPSSSGTRGCQCPRSRSPKFKLFEDYSLQWWEDFMVETFGQLWEQPCGSTVAKSAAKTVESVKALDCTACSARVTEGMRDFSELLTRKIEEVVFQIKLDFSEPRSGQGHGWRRAGISGQGGSKKGKKKKT